MIQISCIQIDNFGHFTEEMGNNREHKIQILLSELFIFLQQQFNKYNGLVFSASKDIMIAVSNGISVENHQFIIDELEKNFPITISIGIGVGETPLEAQNEASKALITHRRAQSSRRKVLAYNGYELPVKDRIKVAHLDINFYTKIAIEINPFYSNIITLNKSYMTLMESFEKKGALCFFSGGDNFICICPNSMQSKDIDEIIDLFEEKHHPWKLKTGIGIGENILEAISKANICLKEIREQNNEIRLKILN